MLVSQVMPPREATGMRLLARWRWRSPCNVATKKYFAKFAKF
jgi:hypothetical protein